MKFKILKFYFHFRFFSKQCTGARTATDHRKWSSHCLKLTATGNSNLPAADIFVRLHVEEVGFVVAFLTLGQIKLFKFVVPRILHRRRLFEFFRYELFGCVAFGNCCCRRPWHGYNPSGWRGRRRRVESGSRRYNFFNWRRGSRRFLNDNYIVRLFSVDEPEIFFCSAFETQFRPGSVFQTLRPRFRTQFVSPIANKRDSISYFVFWFSWAESTVSRIFGFCAICFTCYRSNRSLICG